MQQLHFHATVLYGGINLQAITKEDAKLIEAAFHIAKPSQITISGDRIMQVLPRDWKAVCGDILLTRAIKFSNTLLPIDSPCPNLGSEWSLSPCSCRADSPCIGVASRGTMADGTFVVEMFSEDLDGQAPGTGHYRVEVNSTPVGIEPIMDRSYLPARHRLSQSILFSMIHSFIIRTFYTDDGKHYILNCETIPCKRDCMTLKYSANADHVGACYGCYPVNDIKLQEMLDELKRNCCGQNFQHKFIYQALLLENDSFFKQFC